MLKPSDTGKKAREMVDLRRERDRFVALAFSSADVLLELDRDGTIVFVVGTTGALLGYEPEDLVGRDFISMVAAKDQAMVREGLVMAAKGTRLSGLVLHLNGARGPTPPLMMLGYQLGVMEGHYFLGLRMGVQDARTYARDSAESTETGLPTVDSFLQLAGEKLAELARDEVECKLTMVNLDALSDLRKRVDEETRTHLNESIGGALRSNAIGGELAGELGEAKYGVVHRPDMDVEALHARLNEIARAADPEKKGITVSGATVELDSQCTDSAELTKALGYIFNRFAVTDPSEFSIQSLTDGFSSMMDDAMERMGAFRQILDNSGFTIAFQPVVDLNTRRPHHFEALARFNDLPEGTSPYETITFAEQTGLIQEFDLAMCNKVLDWLDMATRTGQRYMVAVNVSGTSIASPGFVKSLHSLLAERHDQRESIMFEVTESAKITDLEKVNAALQSLRSAGHIVCLDDFGAGAAAFQYLRDLEVDVVKIDGKYVKGALKTGKDVAFLRAMASLCNDLGITTIAEMVEDERSLGFLRDCGIDYGQGYLFGRPSPEISNFDAPKLSEFRARVRTDAKSG